MNGHGLVSHYPWVPKYSTKIWIIIKILTLLTVNLRAVIIFQHNGQSKDTSLVMYFQLGTMTYFSTIHGNLNETINRCHSMQVCLSPLPAVCTHFPWKWTMLMAKMLNPFKFVVVPLSFQWQKIHWNVMVIAMTLLRLQMLNPQKKPSF